MYYKQIMWFVFISLSTKDVGGIVVIMNLWKAIEIRSCQSSEKMNQVPYSKFLESKVYFHEL